MEKLKKIREYQKLQEKKIDAWKWHRWLMIVVSFFCVLGMFLFIDGLEKVNIEEVDLINKFSSYKVQQYIDFRIVFLQLKVKAFIWAVFLGVAGLFILINTLTRWNKHLYESAINDIVKSHIENLTK